MALHESRAEYEQRMHRVLEHIDRRRHDLSKPQDVRGRNSDNTRLKKVLGWKPSISLEQGLAVTYRWIEGELRKNGRTPAQVIMQVAETERVNAAAGQD